MEELEQEPEEIPMEDVLAEIRRMLSAKVESDVVDSSSGVQDDTRAIDEVVYNPPSKQPEPVSKALDSTVEVKDYFLLTPDMRCDDLFNQGSPAQVKLQTQKVLHKLGQGSEKIKISPELEAWLNQNLPTLIDRAVAKQLSKTSV